MTKSTKTSKLVTWGLRGGFRLVLDFLYHIQLASNNFAATWQKTDMKRISENPTKSIHYGISITDTSRIALTD